MWLKTFVRFLTINKVIYFSLKPGHMWTQNGQSSSGQRCGRQHGEVCFNMSTRKILRGNIMDSAADVSLCLHAWNWGWALWSKWKCTAEVCSAGESKLCSQSKSETVSTSRFSQVPLQSLPSVITDMGIPRPAALIHPCLGTAGNHLAPSVETLRRCQQWQTTEVDFPINSVLSSVYLQIHAK